MRVLIACEFSGVVREAFRKHGHDAWSCDILPALSGNDFHIQGDALHWAARRQWDLMIAHPPCTFLSNSGVKHLYKGGKKRNGKDPLRWHDMEKAAYFFRELTYAPVKRIAIENPIMHGYARAVIDPHTQSWTRQLIEPWQFGHGETKQTYLWLKNLPFLTPTDVVEGREPRVHFESPGVKNGLTRQQRRSIFLQGWADAMADQWGGLK